MCCTLLNNPLAVTLFFWLVCPSSSFKHDRTCLFAPGGTNKSVVICTDALPRSIHCYNSALVCLLFVGILLGLPAQRVRVFSQVQVSMIAIGEHVICCGHLGWGYNVKSLPIISAIDPGGSEIHHKCHKKSDSGHDGSKWLDINGSRLDLGGIHPGRPVFFGKYLLD